MATQIFAKIKSQTKNLLGQLRRLLLWIPVLSLFIGTYISFHIYKNLRDKERATASAESAQRFQEMLSQVDLQLANSALRVQSYEEYIGANPRSYKSDARLIAQSLDYTLFQRVSIFRNLHLEDPVSHLPSLQVLLRINAKNSTLSPPTQSKVMISENLLRVVQAMIQNPSLSRQLVLFEFAHRPLVSYVSRSKYDTDVFFVFTAPMPSIFEKTVIRPGESLYITDNFFGTTWKVEREGSIHQMVAAPVGFQKEASKSGHQQLFSDALPQSGFHLHFAYDMGEEYNKWSPALITGLSSLTITFVISFLFFVLARQNSLVTRLVIERTQDLEKVRHELQETLMGKTRFLGNISHEIRTPLNLILGMIDLCEEDELASERTKQYLKTMRSSGNHLLSLIEDLLDLAKSESNDLQIQNKKINLTQLLEELSRMAGQDCLKKDLRFYTQFPCDLPLGIQCDPSRLRQILMNLLRNASKYTNQGHVGFRVFVRERSKQKIGLRFEVEDTGVGIPDDKLGKVFDAFFQIEGSYVFSEGGVGLGLAIVKELVHKLGGKLNVRSEPKFGSIFQVDLDFDVTDNTDWYETFRVAEGGKRNLTILSDDPRWIDSIETLGKHHLVGLTIKRTDQWADILAHWNPGPDDWLLVDASFRNFSGEFTERDARRKNVIFSGNKKSIAELLPNDDVVVIDNSPTLISEILVQMGFSSRARKRKEVGEEKIMSALPDVLKEDISLVVADDDVGNKELYMAYFKNVPWKIKYASDGQEALDLYKEFSADLIILDVRMPLMDGFEVIEKVREIEADEGKSPTPILLVTADALSTTAERARGLPKVSFLTKPIKKTVLFAAIQNSLHEV